MRLFAEGARLLAFSREGDVWAWEDEPPRGRLSELDAPEREAFFGDPLPRSRGYGVLHYAENS